MNTEESDEPLFLSEAEVARLTGFHVRKRQIEYLRDVLRLPFHINGRGEPVVTRAAVLGQRVRKQVTSWEPGLGLG